MLPQSQEYSKFVIQLVRYFEVRLGMPHKAGDAELGIDDKIAAKVYADFFPKRKDLQVITPLTTRSQTRQLETLISTLIML